MMRIPNHKVQSSKFKVQWALLLCLLVLCACGKKKDNNVIIAPKPEVQKVKTTQKMSDYSQTRDVKWLGGDYKITVKRQSDTSLELVHIDNATYYDNRITLDILRSDGSSFFHREYLKSDFDKCVGGTSSKNALLGIVYVKCDSQYLYFAASVGSPDVNSDEYIPMVLKIDRQGGTSVSKDEQLDTGGDAASDEEDEE